MFVVETRQAYIGLLVTNIHESQNSLQVKFYKGKVALDYSKKVVCLVIKKKQEQSINTEHQKMNSASTLVRKIGEYLKQ